MANVIQLSFDFAPEASPRVHQEITPSFAGLKSLNPCPSCEYYGMCDSDECAAKLYLLDSPFPSTRFRNLAEFINFKKQHGWL